MTILTRDQMTAATTEMLKRAFGISREIDKQRLEKVLKAFKNKPDALKAMLDYLSYEHSTITTPTAVLERADVARSHIRYKL